MAFMRLVFVLKISAVHYNELYSLVCVRYVPKEFLPLLHKVYDSAAIN